MIRGVLLIPPEGDPAGLLDPGVGGSCPPTAILDGDVWEAREEYGDRLLEEVAPGHYEQRDPDGEALVLAWDGEVSPVGCFAAYGIFALHLSEQIDCLLRDFKPRYWGSWDDVRDYLKDQGTVVLVDGDGREVA